MAESPCVHESVPMNWKEYGLSTLRNIGASCYINSAFQCLAHTVPLTQYLLDDEYVEDCHEKTAVLDHYVQLLKGFWNGNWIITPKSFATVIARDSPHLNPWRQQDSNECVVYILDKLHESLSYMADYEYHGVSSSPSDEMVIRAFNDMKVHYKSTYSRILELFGGQYHARVQCTNCRKINHRFEPNVFLELPIDRDLTSCFRQFCQLERLDSDNLYHCDGCGQHTQADKKMTLWRLPKILIVTLKRFSVVEKHGRYLCRRNSSAVQFPMTNLDLDEFNSGPNDSETKYDLYAVNCHIGCTDGGHYFSVCLNTDDRWWLFDDDKRRAVSEKEVQRIGQSDAYMLFYRRRDVTW